MKKIYLVIAFICIFCFSSKAVLAVESMPIYYEIVYDYNDNVIHIDNSEQGGECFLVGDWDSDEKKCQFNQDLYGKTIFIDDNNIILEGNGKKIEGLTDIKGIIVDGKNKVKINNFILRGFSSAIYIKDSVEISIENNKIFGTSIFSKGIELLRSNGNIIKSNFVVGQLHTAIAITGNNNNISENNISDINSQGISIAGSGNNIFLNLISNVGTGISTIINYSNNHFYDNTISNCGYGFIMSAIPGYFSSGNKVYRNNFIGNREGDAGCGGRYGIAGCQEDLFYRDLPEGGNYWNNNCADVDNNGICDSSLSRVFPAKYATGSYYMIDNYPWVNKDGWKNYPSENNNFSFAHITDAHLGSNPILRWSEEQSYPRFADTLYEISRLADKPDFILIGGDNVEYAGGESGLRYLRDFKSMIDSFTANTGILVYVVPGNHDRYEAPVASLFDPFGGNDELLHYRNVIKVSQNQGVINLFNETSEEEFNYSTGYDPFNFYFTKGEFQIIGLDSGADGGGIDLFTFDFLPFNSGLSANHISVLEDLPSEKKKIIFMHSPVFNEGTDQIGTSTLIEIPNGAISSKREQFIEYCENNNVELVLSGHTHKSAIYYSENDTIDEPEAENTLIATTTRPLFIQTPSATVDDTPHGYRIIDIEDGDIIPRTSSITDFQPKLVADLCVDYGRIPKIVYDGEKHEYVVEYDDYNNKNCNNNLKLKFLNPWILDEEYITPQGENVNFPKEVAFFTASSSNRLILYNNDFLEKTKVDIDNPFSNEEKYNLFLQKNNKPLDKLSYDNVMALKINNEIFGNNSFIISSNLQNKIMAVYNVVIAPNTTHEIIVLWDVFAEGNGKSGMGLFCDKNNNGVFEDDEKSDLEFLIEKTTVDLGSPGELRVYNEAGEVSGLAEREIKEDIPYSIYVPEDEKVIIFSDDSGNNNYKYEVAGTADDTYDLEIKSEKEGEDAIIFKADAIQTEVGINHRYSVDWEALRNNEDAVIIEIDNDGDGQYEHSANIGAEFSDKIAPVSKIFVNGEAVGGWINVAAEVSFYAGDNDGGIGVEKIEYSLDGGLTWLEYSDPFVIGDEGIHNIVYRATDYFGNQEEIRSADIKIDMTSPEAKIFVAVDNADLEITGMDNLTSIATVWENDNICTITDEAGNFIKLDFDKIKEKKKLVQAKIDKIEYGDGSKSFLPKNHLIYTWAMPNNILLNQIIEVKNEFNVSARYDKKSDQTIVKYRDSGNKKIESRFDGLKILELFTARGKLNYQF